MKRTSLFVIALALSLFAFASCGTTKSAAFAKMYEEDPLVMLIIPPINNSTNVDAKDYFYTTLNVPLAESGYYVLPPAATLSFLQRNSAYDSEQFIDGDLKKFGTLFGADVAIFTVIKKWEKSVIGSKVKIQVEYIFKSTKTNEILFDRDATISCDTSVNVGGGLVGLLASAALSAVNTAATEYVTVAVKCNNNALSDVPLGKYHTRHGADGTDSAMYKEVNLSVK